MAEENMALATLGNPRLDTESYIYIYGPDRWITSPNVTVLSTKVTEIMTTPTDSGVHRRYILSTDYCVIPSNAKVEVKIRYDTKCAWFVFESLISSSSASGSTSQISLASADDTMQVPAMTTKKCGRES